MGWRLFDFEIYRRNGLVNGLVRALCCYGRSSMNSGDNNRRQRMSSRSEVMRPQAYGTFPFGLTRRAFRFHRDCCKDKRASTEVRLRSRRSLQNKPSCTPDPLHYQRYTHCLPNVVPFPLFPDHFLVVVYGDDDRG